MHKMVEYCTEGHCIAGDTCPAETVEQRAYLTVSCAQLLFMEYDPAHCLPAEIEPCSPMTSTPPSRRT